MIRLKTSNDQTYKAMIRLKTSKDQTYKALIRKLLKTKNF
ncbi:unnamed protein product [Rhodiola kirilowii]